MIAFLLLVLLAREIAAQPLPRSATGVRNRRIDQKLAALLVPIDASDEPESIPLKRKLRVRGTVSLENVPLHEALERLSQQFNVTILADERALEEASVSPEEPVTILQTDAQLKDILNQIRGAKDLESLELTWSIEGGMAVLTTREKAQALHFVKLYPVFDLADANLRDAGFEELQKSIEKAVDPGSWDKSMSPGYAVAIPSLGIFVISQTQQNHDAISDYLADLRQRNVRPGDRGIDWDAAATIALASTSADVLSAMTPEFLPGVTEAHLRLQRQLDQTVSFEVEEVPLEEWVRQLRKDFKVSIQMDAKALEEASVTPDQPINLSVRNVSLRRALAVVLSRLELTYLFRYDQIVITTTEKANILGELRVFPVADLVANENDPYFVDADTLMTLLYEMVSPDSWEEAGGPGRTVYDHVSCSFTMNQTREVLDGVKRLLTALRLARHRLQLWREQTTHLLRLSEAKRPSIRATQIPTSGQLSKRSIVPIPLDLIPPSRAVLRQLNTHITFEKQAIVFSELLEQFRDRYGIRFEIDPSAKDPRFNDEGNVSLEVCDVPLGAALAEVLSRYELGYRVAGDTVVIASIEEIKTTLTTVAYPARDLVADSNASDYDQLVVNIMGVVSSDAWEVHGGPGKIAVSTTDGTLVISQTADVHTKVEQILTAWRRAKAVSDSQTQIAGATSKTVSLVSQRLGTPERPRRGHKGSGAIGMGGGGFFAIEEDFTPGGSNANTAAKPDR